MRDEIDFIIKEKFINEILKLRNDAAHADTSGKEREVKQDQVDYAVQHLTSILIHLRAIAKEINNIKDSENCET